MSARFLFFLLSFAIACAPEPAPDVAGRAEALAEPGPWRIPASTLVIGDMQTVELTEAGPWVGPSGCSGGHTEGARELAAYIRMYFPGVSRTEGYACRAIVGIPDQMSVHGTGRAIDIYIPTDGGEADNGLGDPIGNWLIEHAEEVGIQRVIWDRWTWWSEVPPGYSRSMPYDWEGSHPHHDHLHVEMSVAGSERRTAFFAGPMAPPTPAGCGTLPSRGGTIDDTDECFSAFGNPDYWRVVSAGHGGSSLWTNAWANDTPSNWAQWYVRVGAPGDYEVAVNTVGEFAVYDDVRYEVRHDGRMSPVRLDQSAADGWRSLGVFRFAGGSGESVSVYDNYAVSPGSDQHISVDALRLTWAGEDPPPTDPPPTDPPPSDGGTPGDGGTPPPSEDGGWPVDDAGTPIVDDAGGTAPDGGVTEPPPPRTRSGCSAGGGDPVGPAWLVMGLAVLGVMRRRRRRD